MKTMLLYVRILMCVLPTVGILLFACAKSEGTTETETKKPQESQSKAAATEEVVKPQEAALNKAAPKPEVAAVAATDMVKVLEPKPEIAAADATKPVETKPEPSAAADAVKPLETKPIAAATADAAKTPESASPSTVSINAGRLCELTVKPCERDGKPCSEVSQCMITLARMNPEGSPLDLNLTGPEKMKWKWAEDGRLMESPTAVYTLADNGKGKCTKKQGGDVLKVAYDNNGNIVKLGDSVKYTYTDDGRTASISSKSDGKWYTTHYKWGDKGDFKIQWDMPDGDEFCEPEPEKVRLDAQGRVLKEEFSSCQINYSPFTLKYKYDAEGHFSAIDVTCHPDDAASSVTWHLNLKYSCEK